MFINKYLTAFAFTLISLFSFAQQESHLGDRKVGNQLQGQPILHVKDPKYNDIKNQKVFTSVNPTVSIHFGFNDDKSNTAEYTQIYSAEVQLQITPYDNSNAVKTNYTNTNNQIVNYPNPYIVTLKIKHDNVTKGLQFDDYAVYNLPGIHKADVQILSITYYDEAGTITTIDNSLAYVELKFNTDRYYNLQLSSTQSSSVLPLEHHFVKYEGTEQKFVSSVSAGAEEILISWQKDPVAPAVEYELEWTWVDNFGANGTNLLPNQILLSDQDFKLNSTRIQTKELNYRIPIIYSKGYIVYRVRPVGRFLDDISKNYYGNWTSGYFESHKLLSEWSNFVEIDENHESGKKNWQYQSSFAENGKKKEVVSYFDGSLRNRQTVTKINSNNQAVVGEVIYDNQGRPAIEVLPVPVESSGIHFYPELNKNSQSTSIYNHNDFDWDNKNEKICDPTPIKAMANTSGASKYYSSNNIQQNNHQDLVPDANLLPFSQTVYTPDNTGRIKSKGGVGKDHQIGSGHEMKYFYGTPTQPELNRLFGYKVGEASRYKKNTVVDPNGQISVSYLDPQGRTIATALAGDKKGNLISLEEETIDSLHVKTTYNLLVNNDKYISGNNGIVQDGIKLNTSVDVVKKDKITFNYDLKKTIGSFNDACLPNKYYPFVYNWSVSMTDDCANELLVPATSSPLFSQIGTYSISSYAPTSLDIDDKIFEGKIKNKDNNYEYLNEGKYSLSKNLQIDTESLEKYANDYIAQLELGTTCKPVVTQFTEIIQTTDCNVTCISCEEALVTSNLENASDKAAYKGLLPANQNSLGDTTARNAYILIAETKYINTNLSNIDTTGALAAYTEHYRKEFRALLTNCRELCQQPVNLCNINEEILLADVSPNGQYGSTIGLEVPADPTQVDLDIDPLSVFNVSNQLLYRGFKLTTDVDPDNPAQNITIMVSESNWKYPVGGYQDENEEPSKISVIKNEDGSYSPALRPLVDNGPIPTVDDPNSDDENYRLVDPQYLSNVADFLKLWQPSWAKALLPFHPEYQYYLYNKAICLKTISGENSDGFDEKLRDLDYYNAETPLVENSSIFQSGGMVKNLINSYTTIDPFYNGMLSTETPAEFDVRKKIMKEGLEDSFDEISFTNSQGTTIKMNMLQAAYFFAAYSNGLTPVTAYESVLNKSNDALLSSINGLPDKYLKQRIWSNFKGYYIALKEKTRTVFAHIYANKKMTNNDCIGNKQSTETYKTLLKKYNTNSSKNYEAVTNLITISLGTQPEIPSGLSDILSTCSTETAPFFYSKEKRFVPADYSYDSGLSDQNAMANADAKANANLYLETGKCPLALDMETFLKGLTDSNIQPNGLLLNIPTYSMPYLTAGIFNAQLNAGYNVSTATESPKIIGRPTGTNNSELEIDFMVGTNSIATPIKLKFINNTNYKNPCGESVAPPTWADVAGFKNFHYESYEAVTKTFKFKILATIVRKGTTPTCITPEEIIIEGYTKAAVGECHFTGGVGVGETIAFDDTQCNKKELFISAFRDLVLDLQSTNQLFNANVDITNNSVFKNGYLRTYFGIQNETVTFKETGSDTPGNDARVFSIFVNDKRVFSSGRPARLSIGTIIDVFASPYSNSVTVKHMRSGNVPEITSWSLVTGKGKPLYFACCAPCGEWDYDNDGYGDLCGDPAGVVACELYASEEQNYEENLKIALNAIISNPPSGNQSSSNNIAIRNFISSSNLIQRFQSLRNYYRKMNPNAFNYVVDLANYSAYINTDMILLKFANSNYSHEAEIKLTIPNADKIKNINSIDYINETTVKVKYTTVTNQTYIVQSNVKLTNAIALSGIEVGYASNLCELMSNDYPPIKVVGCNRYKTDEELFENSLKDAFNYMIEDILNGNYQTIGNQKQTIGDDNTLGYKTVVNNSPILNFIENNKIKERYTVLSGSGINNGTVGVPIFNKYCFTIRSTGSYVLQINNSPYFNSTTNPYYNNWNNGIIQFYSPDFTNIKHINSIDIKISPVSYESLIEINFVDTSGNVLTKEGTFDIYGRYSERNGQYISLCTFLNYLPPTSTSQVTLARTASKLSTSLIVSTPTCSDICVPPTVTPVVCGDKWQEFKTRINAQMPTYQLPVKLKDNGTFFCEANYGYISKEYVDYLVKLNITTAQNPLFLTIAEFGSTKLKYGNDETPNVINAYYSYIQTQNSNPSGETKNWNDFANSYVTSHNVCAPATLTPSFNLEIPSKPEDKTPCEIYKKAINDINIQQVSESFYADKKEAFKQNYLKAAFEGLNETLTKTAIDKEYQYTLYYYDQAGNLVQTVPPEGVKRLQPNSNVTIDDVRQNNILKEDTADINGTKVAPAHKMQTQYRYNSLNQLVWQQTPDGGITRFAYDELGRIMASQNANQIDNSQFSYTRYDGLGRIIEAGQFKFNQPNNVRINENGRLVNRVGTPLTTVNTNPSEAPYPYYFQDITLEQITKTIYDNPVKDSQTFFTSYGSDNSHNRVTAVLYFDTITGQNIIDGYTNGIFYDYDVHGNVKELVHYINNQKLKTMGVATKKVVYDYDLISGNVNKVTYQPNNAKEQFIHRYEYDADNRIKQVYTSKDNTIWEKEANYLYYDHGPLARVEIGDKQVQGLDYIYTLQGWLKGVNSERIGSNFDAGKDGLNVAQDAFGFALNYYKGDYKSRFNTRDNNIFSYSNDVSLQKENTNLYNGNIKEMITSLTDHNQSIIATQFNYYRYDQLNRIREMTSKSILGTTSKDSYSSTYSYDKNGNIKTLFNSAPLNGVITPMDQLTYQYKPGKNQLKRVNDAIGNGVFSNSLTNPNDTSLDIDNQYDKTNPGNTDYNNYEYDNIGQLTQDKQEGIHIDWRVDGKVKTVTKDNGTVISFEYDGLGNRIAKTLATGTKTTTTYYLRDAQGNVLSTYEMIKEGSKTTYFLVEQDIYGSSRLGTEKRRIQISEDIATQQLRMASLSSKLVASAEPMSLTVSNVTEAPANTQFGLNFDSSSEGTWWKEKPVNSINLFNNQSQKTKGVSLNAHLKIGSDNLGTNLLAALHGTSREGNSWPGDHSFAYLSSVFLSVKKVDGGYLPVVSLVKYTRAHNHYYIWKKLKKRDRFSFRSYKEITNYNIASTPIPENEWDIQAEIIESSDPDSKNGYKVNITLNGNFYTTIGSSETPDMNGDEDKGNERDATALNLDLPNNSLGATKIRYRPGNEANATKFFPALKSEICDFQYKVDNGQDKDEIQINYFGLDEGLSSTIAYSTTGHTMNLTSTQAPTITSPNFAATYCGSKDGDKDGDGVKDFEDNCPNIFNPGQEDDDRDGVGNVCDNCRDKANGKAQANIEGVGNQLDTDGDGVGDVCDNCKYKANFDQKDTDDDGYGDVCDNCPGKANPDQKDENQNGIGDICEGEAQGEGKNAVAGVPVTAYRFVGDKQYELSNHLGNVLSVITDRSLFAGNHFTADVTSFSDYYPFGMLVPSRHGSSDSYRYGFNGKEKDDEIKGEGNSYDYGMRMYDPRSGKFFSVDPLTDTFPWYSPYQFAGNSPIAAIDLDGEEPKIVITSEITGTTKMHVYGAGNLDEIIVKTYKAIVQYTDGKGKTTEIGTFNITRDGWFSMGSDSKGNALLYNRSSDPADNKKHYIQEIKKEYYSAEPAFQISPIYSPIYSTYNKNYFIDGLPDAPLPSEVIRDNNESKGAQIHIAGLYIDKYGKEKLAGTYGCFGIVDPSQVSPKEGVRQEASNNEMKRFSESVEKAQSMQIKEHKKKADVEVDIKPRSKDVVKHVRTNKRLVKG